MLVNVVSSSATTFTRTLPTLERVSAPLALLQLVLPFKVKILPTKAVLSNSQIFLHSRLMTTACPSLRLLLKAMSPPPLLFLRFFFLRPFPMSSLWLRNLPSRFTLHLSKPSSLQVSISLHMHMKMNHANFLKALATWTSPLSAHNPTQIPTPRHFFSVPSAFLPLKQSGSTWSCPSSSASCSPSAPPPISTGAPTCGLQAVSHACTNLSPWSTFPDSIGSLALITIVVTTHIGR